MAIRTLNIKGRLTSLNKPLVMGILNVTPDSFYAASRKTDTLSVVKRIEAILSEGGEIVDVGGYSTRPDAAEVSAEEEWKRLEPALKILMKDFPQVTVSVDTFRADIACRAVEEYGVAIINDISGGAWDDGMFPAVARLQAPYILTHGGGCNDGIFEEVLMYFAGKLRELRLMGVNDVIIDPGFGFGKTHEQNYELMRRLHEIKTLTDCPLLVGISRKRMIYNELGCTADESLNGTTALNTFALLNGADILRVHDVKAAVDAVMITEKLKN